VEGKIVFPEPEEYKVEDIMLPPESNMPTYVPGLRLTEISHLWFGDMAQISFQISSIIDEGLCTVSKLLGVKYIRVFLDVSWVILMPMIQIEFSLDSICCDC
jgi:hypothetical protein